MTLKETFFVSYSLFKLNDNNSTISFRKLTVILCNQFIGHLHQVHVFKVIFLICNAFLTGNTFLQDTVS